MVVYIINPFNDATAMADICSAFWQLAWNYKIGMDKQQAQHMNDVVLQIVPLDFITSTESLVVSSQAEYFNLAMEVYSRCPPTDYMGFAPPVVLTEPIQSTIKFKLSSERISPLRESKSLHMAYSKSLDQRWITVAWTDDTGSFEKTVCYCLRLRNTSGIRSVSDVRNAIWATTVNIIERKQMLGRVVFVNTEPMDLDEVEGKRRSLLIAMMAFC